MGTGTTSSTSAPPEDISIWEHVYQFILLVIRVATNALAVPVWAAVVGIFAGIFGGRSIVDAAGQAFRSAFAWSFGSAGGVIVVIVFAALGLVHAIRLWSARSWVSVPAFLFFVLDHTWSLPNTIVGSLFATVTAGIEIDEAGSKGSGRLLLVHGIFGDYDTTLGNVTAGKKVPSHELVHVIQARLTGPFFYPVYLANYAVNLIPYWWLLKLIFKIYPSKPIDSVGRYFTRGVYPFTVFEAIAYAVEGSPP